MSDAVPDQTTGSRPPGFYDDGHGTSRWWDGRGWTEHLQGGVPVPRLLRVAHLNAEVAKLVKAGYFVQMNDGRQAVVSRVRRMGWFWLNRKVDRRILTVDEFGIVRTR